jgi:IS605 OrfB family transposase
VTVEVPDGSPVDPEGWLGVDLGIRNLAVDSDGEAHSGAAVEAVRQRHQRLRNILQPVGTKSAKSHLKKLSGKEARFRSHTNHVISKHIVAKAKGTGRGIAVEDLTGIRDRATVRRSQRAMHSGWAFFQLRAFLSYKAAIAGVKLVAVDPRNTSRTCPACGYIDKANRKSQSEFACKSCGFVDHADHVGAVNIARRAAVNQPIVSDYRGGEHLCLPISVQGQSCLL